MKKTTIKRIKDVILGLLLIFAAVLLILRSADVALPLLGGLSFFKIAGALVVLVFIIFRLIDRKFSLILQALTILYGIFLEEIAMLAGVEKSTLPSFWIVFLCSIIVEIGFGLIFKKKEKFNFGKVDFTYSNEDDDNNDDNDKDDYDDDDYDDDDDDRTERLGKGEGVSLSGHKIGEVSRYIDCRDFKRAEFGKMIGEVNIYFDNTDQYKGGGELVFRKLVGEVCIYVPADWKIKSSGTGFLGEVEIEPSKTEGDKVLTITSQKSIGQIRVFRR